jgi:hypothetical protein
VRRSIRLTARARRLRISRSCARADRRGGRRYGGAFRSGDARHSCDRALTAAAERSRRVRARGLAWEPRNDTTTSRFRRCRARSANVGNHVAAEGRSAHAGQPVRVGAQRLGRHSV